MTHREHERDERGRFTHSWGGVIAQERGGDWEQCEGCGRVRRGGKGRVLEVVDIPQTALRVDSDELFWGDDA